MPGAAVPKLTQAPARMRQPARPAAPPATAPAFLAPWWRTALVRAVGRDAVGALWARARSRADQLALQGGMPWMSRASRRTLRRS